MSLPSSTTLESIEPAPGTWVTQGDVPADFNPTSSDSETRTDSDCTYRNYCWSFGGTATGTIANPHCLANLSAWICNSSIVKS